MSLVSAIFANPQNRNGGGAKRDPSAIDAFYQESCDVRDGHQIDAPVRHHADSKNSRVSSQQSDRRPRTLEHSYTVAVKKVAKTEFLTARVYEPQNCDKIRYFRIFFEILKI
jgi:hypothetical protein